MPLLTPPVAAIIDRIPRNGSFSLWRDITPGDTYQSAVLIPLFPSGDSLLTLFLRRSRRLSRHGGEICFPGGLKEPDDDSPLRTALREAEEETGIPPDSVKPLTVMTPEYTVVSGVEIIPVLGLVCGIDPERELVLSRSEISKAYTVDILEFTLTPRRRTIPLPAHKKSDLEDVSFPEYDLPDGTVIWGVTARILERVRHLLQ